MNTQNDFVTQKQQILSKIEAFESNHEKIISCQKNQTGDEKYQELNRQLITEIDSKIHSLITSSPIGSLGDDFIKHVDDTYISKCSSNIIKMWNLCTNIDRYVNNPSAEKSKLLAEITNNLKSLKSDAIFSAEKMEDSLLKNIHTSNHSDLIHVFKEHLPTAEINPLDLNIKKEVITHYTPNNLDVQKIAVKAIHQKSNKDEYIDKNKLIKGSKKDYAPPIPAQNMWYLNQAILRTKMQEGIQIDPEVRRQLEILTLQAFSKATPFDDRAAWHGAIVSPIFQKEHYYHREGRNLLLEAASLYFAREMGLGNYDKIHFVSSELVKEVFDRTWINPTELDIKIANSDDFEILIDKFSLQLKEDRKLNPTSTPGKVTIDISNIIVGKLKNGEKIDDIIKSLLGIVVKYIKEFMNDCPCQYSEAVDIFHENLRFIAYMEYSGQQVLFTPPILGENKEFNDEIDQLLQHSGFRISPEQARANFLKVRNIEDIIESDSRASIVEFGTSGSTFPEDVFKNFDGFLKSNVFKQFTALSGTDKVLGPEAPTLQGVATLPNTDKEPPYLKIIPKAIAALLEGFKSYDIDNIFKEKKINDLLQATYFVLIEVMRDAIFRKDDFKAFSNDIEVIQHLIQSIITIVQPYDDKALEKVIVQRLTSGNDPILPSLKSCQPKVHLKNAAMGALSSILGGAEKQKGNNQLNVAILEGCYYESCHVLKAETYSQSTLNGDLTRKDSESAYAELKEFSKLKPIDLFLCEFHHNLSKNDNKYEKEDVKEHIKYMFANGCAAEKMTVVIDTTIGLELSNDIRDLLADPKIQELIESGRLNIALLKSAQKFDMLGMDNYYGGITTTFNNPEKFNLFNERMDDKRDQLKGVNYQGLTHIQTCIGSLLDDYRSSIIKNTNLLYDKLPKKMISEEATKNDISIANKIDTGLPYIHLNIPSKISYGVTKALNNFVESENLLYTSRDSFGFMNMNETIIGAPGKLILRFSPGLEGESDINKYAKFFEILQGIMDATGKFYDPNHTHYYMQMDYFQKKLEFAFPNKKKL